MCVTCARVSSLGDQLWEGRVCHVHYGERVLVVVETNAVPLKQEMSNC